LTARCLRELDRLRDGRLAFETIVVDNASTDETRDEIARFPWVRYDRRETNTNFAGACNTGAALAQAPIVLFLNNDAYPQGDALAPLLRAFDREDVVVAGALLLYEDGPVQAAGHVLLENAHWWLSQRSLPANVPGAAMERDAGAVSGAAMAVRREWFAGEGGFDEGYRNGYEDVDLCMRAHAGGKVVRYVPKSRFGHYESATAGRFDYESENERRFYRRWHRDLAGIPRTNRGELGAIRIIDESRSAAHTQTLADLRRGIAGYGHPILRGSPAIWMRVDGRFRHVPTLAWFGESERSPQVRVALFGAGRLAVISTTIEQTRVEAPFLPCVAQDAIAAICFTPSDVPANAVAVYAGTPQSEHGLTGALLRALREYETLTVLPFVLPGEEPDAHVLEILGTSRFVRLDDPVRTPVDAALLPGLTDPCGRGNVMLQAAGIPLAVGPGDAAGLVGDEAAFLLRDGDLKTALRAIEEVDERKRRASVARVEATRRFSPARSALRIVDLARMARCGFERSGVRRTDSPIPLS
jgi:GT2 family glycosyltransferase